MLLLFFLRVNVCSSKGCGGVSSVVPVIDGGVVIVCGAVLSF